MKGSRAIDSEFAKTILLGTKKAFHGVREYLMQVGWLERTAQIRYEEEEVYDPLKRRLIDSYDPGQEISATLFDVLSYQIHACGLTDLPEGSRHLVEGLKGIVLLKTFDDWRKRCGEAALGALEEEVREMRLYLERVGYAVGGSADVRPLREGRLELFCQLNWVADEESGRSLRHQFGVDAAYAPCLAEAILRRRRLEPIIREILEPERGYRFRLLFPDAGRP